MKSINVVGRPPDAGRTGYEAASFSRWFGQPARMRRGTGNTRYRPVVEIRANEPGRRGVGSRVNCTSNLIHHHHLPFDGTHTICILASLVLIPGIWGLPWANTSSQVCMWLIRLDIHTHACLSHLCVPGLPRKAVKNGLFFRVCTPRPRTGAGNANPCQLYMLRWPMFSGRNVARSHPHVSPTLEQGVEREGREGTFST